MTERLIKENGALCDLRPCSPDRFDDHVYHIMMHKKLLEDRRINRSYAKVDHILKHIEDHARMIRELWEINNT